MKKQDLKVKIVRRYRRAQYPSFADPNPLEHPETLPYPFSQKLLNAFFSMGIGGALLLSSPEVEAGESPRFSQSMSRDSLGNPFTFENTGLPHRTSSFGTGLPSRLSEEEARIVIDSVFRQEGLKVSKDLVIEQDGLKLTANAWDEDANIGYVWLGWKSLDQDGFISWQRPRALNLVNSIRRQAKAAFNRLDSESEKTPALYRESEKWFAQQVEALLANSPPEKQAAIFEQLTFEKHFRTALEQNKKDPALKQAYQEQIFSMPPGPERQEAIEKYFDFFEITDPLYSSLFPKPPSSSTLLAKAIAISQLPAGEDRQEQLLRFNKRVLILMACQRLEATTLPQQIATAFTLEGAAQEKILQEIEQQYDLLRVSIPEIKNMEQLAENQEQYLAPISAYDPRWTYTYRVPKLPAIPQDGSKIKTEEKPKKIIPGTHEGALQELEEQVRQYIRWAKTQQGY